MEVCSNFGSMPDMHNESNAVLMKPTKEELKTLIPDPAKGAMAVDIIRWAMNQTVSDDAKQRKKWSKYKNYWVLMAVVPQCTGRWQSRRRRSSVRSLM